MPRPLPSTLCLRAVDFRPLSEEERNGEGTGDGRTLVGYAAVFDIATEIHSWEGHFFETLSKGAFRKTLKERMPVLQFDHGHDARTGSVPIGRFTDLHEDDKGLFVEARLFDNPVVEPIRQAIEGEAITGMSFRFNVVRDEWRDKDGKLIKGDELLDLLWDGAGDRGPLQRTIKEVKLHEAGPVVFPAYVETSVGVRSFSDDDKRAIVEEYIRTAQGTSDPDPDAVRQDTSAVEDETPAQTPVTPSTVDTSTGHEEVVREAPAPVRSEIPKPRKESVPVMDGQMTIEERTARQGEIKVRLDEINTEYSGNVLPEETQREWDELQGEFRAHDDAISAATERAEQLRALANEPSHREFGSDRGNRSQPRRAKNIYDLNEIRSHARSLDDLADLTRDHAMRAVEQAKFPGVANREAAQERVERLLMSVDEPEALARRILATGSPTYDRAFGKTMKALSKDGLTAEEARAMSLGVDTAGGFAVPFQLDPTVILTSGGSINPLRQISRVEQIVGKEWQGITSAGITVSRSAEATEATANDPTLAQPTVRPTRVTGFVPFSMELDQDWASLRNEITRLLGDAKDQEESVSFTTGNGTGNNPGGVVATLNATSHVDSAIGGAFGSPDVYAVEQALPPRFRDRGRWLANKAIYNKVRQFDTNGGANLWERIGAGQPAELLGYPAHEASAMAAPNPLATGNLLLLFGDFQQFLIVDRIGMSVELVPHLMGTNRMPTGQRGIFAIWRNSSRVLVDNAFRLLKIKA